MCFVWNKDGDGSKELESLHSQKLKVVQLDVCSEEQVSQALQFVTVNLDDPEKGEGCLAHRGRGVQRSFRRTRPPNGKWGHFSVIYTLLNN